MLKPYSKQINTCGTCPHFRRLDLRPIGKAPGYRGVCDHESLDKGVVLSHWLPATGCPAK